MIISMMMMINGDHLDDDDDHMMKNLPLEKRLQVIEECEIPMGCISHRLVALEIGNARSNIYIFTFFHKKSIYKYT